MRSEASELAVCFRLMGKVYPLVAQELEAWKLKAEKIPDPELRCQAMSSLERKRFHCVGGAALALLCPSRLKELVRSIVAVQTISDYLDNLCDRAKASQGLADVRGYSAYMVLHEAFRCALDPRREVTDYYRLYPVAHESCDGGYLSCLVDEARKVVDTLPRYRFALPGISRMSLLYSELQSIKHLSPDKRNRMMEEWFETRRSLVLTPDGLLGRGTEQGLRPDRGLIGRDSGGRTHLGAPRVPLKWWEFGAAAGSTLGIFGLMCASASSEFDAHEAAALEAHYFPLVCALHILLDYLIDLEEDRQGGDLNFVACYPSVTDAVSAMGRFVQEALKTVSNVRGTGSQPNRRPYREREPNRHPSREPARQPNCRSHTAIHRAIIRGLLAMYLSDPKVLQQGMGEAARALVSEGGGLTPFLCWACGGVRRVLSF